MSINVTSPAVVPVVVATQKTSEISVKGFVSIQGDAHYAHNQLDPEAVWTVTHNLGKKPSVTVVDSAETVVIGDVEYIDDNTVQLTFFAAFSGKAYFN